MTLDVVAVEAFTNGRLDRDDDETERQLAAALAAARTYCGWHVSPVVSEVELVLDGPGDRLLVLPTLKITALTAVIEDGVSVDLTELNWSTRGLIAKRGGTYWSGLFGSIRVTFAHGYASAPDFESVVLSAIDRGGFSAESGPRVIGPFQYTDALAPAGSAFTGMERMVLDRYSLERRP